VVLKSLKELVDMHYYCSKCDWILYVPICNICDREVEVKKYHGVSLEEVQGMTKHQLYSYIKDVEKGAVDKFMLDLRSKTLLLNWWYRLKLKIAIRNWMKV